MPAKKYHEDRLNQMMDLREAGKTYKQISKITGMHVSSISWYCLKFGIDHPDKTGEIKEKNYPMTCSRNGHAVRRFTDDEDKLLLEMDAAGKNYTQMGRRLNRKRNSIEGRLMTLARREERKLASGN